MNCNDCYKPSTRATLKPIIYTLSDRRINSSVICNSVTIMSKEIVGPNFLCDFYVNQVGGADERWERTTLCQFSLMINVAVAGWPLPVVMVRVRGNILEKILRMYIPAGEF